MSVPAAQSTLKEQLTQIAKQARAASLELATLSPERKNAALEAVAQALETSTDALLAANKKDLEAAHRNGLTAPMIERLTLNPERIAQIAVSVREVAALPDPVGELLEESTRPNALVIRKVRVPIGVIGIIYESRPNVTIDCAVLCLKSGNASILRGGKEAFHTNSAFAALLAQALLATGLNPHAIQLIPTTDREALTELLKLDQYVHCIIPRGGEALIRFVSENSRIPVIKHYTGVCSVYIDKDADASLAQNILIDAKTQRVSVCNTVENLFIHKDAAARLLPQLGRALRDKNVELRADAAAAAILEKNALPSVAVTEADYYAEFLDYIIAIKVVDSLEEAVACINRYGSAHSDAIVTDNELAAQAFLSGVDSATVYWNASTRFTDGFEFGLGAEIGISTDRLHARGPMGLRELCSYKYLIFGKGQTRGEPSLQNCDRQDCDQ